MKVLVTGSNGFIGKNLCLTLEQRGYEVIHFDRNTAISLETAVEDADIGKI